MSKAEKEETEAKLREVGKKEDGSARYSHRISIDVYFVHPHKKSYL